MRGCSGSAFTAYAVAHVPSSLSRGYSGFTCFPVALRPLSLPVCSLHWRIRPFVNVSADYKASADCSPPFEHCCQRPGPVPRTDAEPSPGKSCNLPPAPARATCARARMTTGRPRPWPGYPAAQALVLVSVRQVQVLAAALFRSCLAADTLALASRSGHHGRQRSLTSWLHDMPRSRDSRGGAISPPTWLACSPFADHAATPPALAQPRAPSPAARRPADRVRSAN
jgi:hypothetical protein